MPIDSSPGDEEAGTVTELTQTLVNAALLIAVTLIAGSIGLKRFEAIDRRFEALDGRFEGRFDAIDRRFEAVDGRFDALERKFEGRFDAIDRRFEAVDGRFDALERKFEGRFDAVDRRFDELRTELKTDIARVDGHVGEARAEIAQVRSDLTYVALAVGARGAEGSD